MRTAYTGGPGRRGAPTVATERCADTSSERIAATRYDCARRPDSMILGGVVVLGCGLRTFTVSGAAITGPLLGAVNGACRSRTRSPFRT